MNKTDTKDLQYILPLTPMQEGMLYHSISEPDSGMYIEQSVCRISGILDIESFKKAWQDIINRHMIFRTSFVWKNTPDLLQIVHHNVSLPFTFFDWRDLPASVQNANFDSLIEDDRAAGFNLNRPPLIRLTLIRSEEQEYNFVFTNHHIILDGWSLAIIIKEFFHLYDVYSSGNFPEYSVRQKEFRHFIQWLNSQDMKKAEKFWKIKLDGIEPCTRLADDAVPQNTHLQDNNTDEEILFLNLDDTRDLIRFVKEQHLTLNTIILAAWGLLLSRILRRSDITFGYTVSGRCAAIEGIDEITGNLINTLPLHLKSDPRLSVTQWLSYVSRELIEIKDFEFTPLYKIHEWAGFQKPGELFDNIVVFENYPLSSFKELYLNEASISDFSHFARTNFPLTLVSAPADKLPLMMSFDKRIYKPSFVIRLLEKLRLLLLSFMKNPEMTLSRISLTSESELDTIISHWNRRINHLSDESIAGVFERIAEKYPENAAVWHEGEVLTYKRLNGLANHLAREIVKTGVSLQKPVGIFAGRTDLMIISIMAVLKAGRAYLPISTEYPDERIEYMIRDSGTELLITTRDLLPAIPSAPARILVADFSSYSGGSSRSFPENAGMKIDPASPSYIIYTSGSTGRPKGTVLTHRGLLNVTNELSKSLNICSSSRILQFSSFSFDASVSEIFMALLNGACIYMIGRDILLSPENLSGFAAANSIDTLTAPPALLSSLNAGSFCTIKNVISAGEACTWDIVRNWQPGRSFFNGYGPTEITIGCCWAKIEDDGSENSRVPIGRPLNNVTLYVMDEFLNIVPPGFQGELCVGGIGVGYGYIGHPEITAMKFIPDPVSSTPGERLYRTGDLVRLLEDGNLEFIGRMDNQVKIRGFRIEPGEIETELLKINSIKNAKVLTIKTSQHDQQLTAYFVAENDCRFEDDELRDILRDRLPQYMIPSAFVRLKDFPLTPNGKIDCRALSAIKPDETINPDDSGQTQSEELLCVLIAKLLNRKTVSASDNFFEIGGHSLKSVQLASVIKEAFGVVISVKDIFNSSTIAEISEKIDQNRKKAAGVLIEKINSPLIFSEGCPVINDLSYSQQRLWFLYKMAPESSYYNMSAAFNIKGESLNIPVLSDSINEIIKRHDILRTVFFEQNGVPKQKVIPSGRLNIQITDISDLNPDNQEAALSKLLIRETSEVFDLGKWPLCRFSIFRLNSNENILSVCMHHIITDGWSMGILSNELCLLYNSKILGAKAELPPLNLQYCDYSAWQRKCINENLIGNHLDYWTKQLSDINPLLELPLDKPRSMQQHYAGSEEKFTISKEVRIEIETINRKYGITSFMTLLAVYQTLLYRYTMNRDIVTGIPVANRNAKEIENLIGFFVNTLAVKLHFDDGARFPDIFKQVRQKTLEAFEHQDIPFDMIIERLHPDRYSGFSPVFHTAFVYQNLELQIPELQGLSVTLRETDLRDAKYDITLEVIEKEGTFELRWNYSTDLFEASTIKRMHNNFMNLLLEILRNPAQKVSEVRMLDEVQYTDIICNWNHTALPFPSDTCIHHLFEAAAARFGNKTAVTFTDNECRSSEMSYSELNSLSNKIAHYLLRKGVITESVIAVAVERSFSMIACLLGVMKAGGAFLPLDPEYPAERTAFMLEDSNAAMILTQAAFAQKYKDFNGRMICVDADGPEIFGEPDYNPPGFTFPDNLAYIIYTSGSTGKPKGAMIRHQGICNLAAAQKYMLDINENDRVFQFSNISFDAAVWDIIMALINGAVLCMSPRNIMSSGELLLKMLSRTESTVVTIPPSVLSAISDSADGKKYPLKELKMVIAAGEKCPVSLAKKWTSGHKFVNAYGPTETTICASLDIVTAADLNYVPIGGPIANFRLFVLDRNMQPLPAGAAGELYIGGCGLARGYLNRPGITAEKFVPDPFSAQPGSRLYRSGDLVRWLPDGRIEFIDRIDSQIKIRGFRVELEEISTVLMNYAPVNKAVVIAKENTAGTKQLAAYVKLHAGISADAADLRNFLKHELPDYMIPSVFVFVDNFPLNNSGKIDKQALLTGFTISDPGNKFVAPRNKTEEVLIEITQNILNVKQVSVMDSFFEMGGHSLIAARYISEIKERFNVELSLQTLFQYPQISDLAVQIDELLVKHSAGIAGAAEIQNEDLMNLLNNIQSLSEEETIELLLRENNRNLNGGEIEPG